MTNTLTPIKVTLTQSNIAVRCLITYDDGKTEGREVTSLSMRGAQREVTQALAAEGYSPAGRWQAGSDSTETVRLFRPGT